jgi:purine-binding chemotaxis protein CheW
MNDQSNQAAKYLTFELNETEFGIEILRVVEILKMMDITEIPMWPSFASGTITIRGRVIPVIDLRQKFGLCEIDETEKTCTVVVEMGDDHVGIVVEAVNEVREIKNTDISQSPSLNGVFDNDFILGMGKTETQTIILLNLDKILVSDDVQELLKDKEALV